MHRLTKESRRPTCLLAAAAVLAALAGCSNPPPVTAPASAKVSTSVTSQTKIISFAVSIENLNVDRVGLRDGYQRPDGNRDLAFQVSIQGPVDAIFVVSTNQKGEPGYGLRADTLVGSEEIPAELGGVIDTGKMTVGVGVIEAGGTKFVNEDNGSIHLGAGVHNLSLYIPNTATLQPGSFVRIYVKAGGALVAGPITPY